MKYSGIVVNSFVDYPGKISTVIFTQGCNMNCYYCHNALQMNKENKELSDAYILDFIKQRKNYIDSIVISGGEPTLQKDLVDFCKKAKALGFFVKLDTNGTNSTILKTLIKNQLVDYIAMDVKCPLEKIENLCGNVNKNELINSIKIIINSKIDYEFRTTIYNDLTLDDSVKIIDLIKGAKNFYIQRCNEENVNREEKTKLLNVIKELALSTIKKVEIRNL